jgi:hypothetical protein
MDDLENAQIGFVHSSIELPFQLANLLDFLFLFASVNCVIYW